MRNKAGQQGECGLQVSSEGKTTLYIRKGKVHPKGYALPETGKNNRTKKKAQQSIKAEAVSKIHFDTASA